MPRHTSVRVGSFAVIDREDLVIGVDKPGPETTGPTGPLTDFGSGSSITISTPGTEGPYGDAHYRKRYKGQMNFAAGLADGALKFRECEFMGPPPEAVTSQGVGGVIKNFGNNPSRVKIFDSLISPGRWVTAEGRPKLAPVYTGIHGGNIDLIRSEISNVHDGWNLIGPNGSNPTAVANQRHLCQQSWIHAGTYDNDYYGPTGLPPYNPDDGHPHCDAFQTNFGQHIDVLGSVLGGPRNMTGYQIWPNGYNSGDDYFNACMMLFQEVSNAAYAKIEDMLIEANWLTGGCVCINFAYNPAHPNTFATTSVINNRFGTRGADWNETLGGSAPGAPPYDMGNGAGKYFIKHTQIQATTTGNVYDDTGLPIPIVTG